MLHFVRGDHSSDIKQQRIDQQNRHFHINPCSIPAYCDDEMRAIGYIPEQNIVYSSEAFEAGNSMINGTPWQPVNDLSPNITINFPDVAKVNAIIVQGGGINEGFLREFTVKVQNVDEQWEDIKDQNNETKVYLYFITI